MALPIPNFDDCCPKEQCLSGINVGEVYSTCDPCRGLGLFNKETCDCEGVRQEYPALYVNTVEVTCDYTETRWGWFGYAPSTEAQRYAPVSLDVNPINPFVPCNPQPPFDNYGRLTVIATFSDGTTRTFFGGNPFVDNPTQSRELVDWNFGDVNDPGYFPMTLTRN